MTYTEAVSEFLLSLYPENGPLPTNQPTLPQ
jgi:hypothetical protein